MQKVSKKSKRSAASSKSKSNCESKIMTATVVHGTMAANNIRFSGFDKKQALLEHEERLKALGVENDLQAMLSSQLIAIHNLQQVTASKAREYGEVPDAERYYINSTVKLANAFTQQAALLAKLQGQCNQKVVVEHVTVNDGGQAIVGNVTGSPSKKRKRAHTKDKSE